MDEKQLSGSYEALFQQGDLSLRSGDIAGAQEIFSRLHSRLARMSDKVRTLRPELEDLRIMSTEILASLHRDQGDFEKAGVLYQELIDTTPTSEHSMWKHALAWITINRGEITRGLDMLRGLTVENPDDQSLWVSLAGVLVRENLLDEAESALKHAIALPPAQDDEENRMIYGMLFVLLKRQKRYDEAVALWQEWMDRFEIRDSIPIYEMYLDLNEPEKLAECLQSEKDSIIRGYYQAAMAQQQGNDVAAAKAWRKVAAKPMKTYGLTTDMWAEAALHSSTVSPETVHQVLIKGVENNQLSMRGMLIFAATFVHLDDPDGAHRALELYRDRMEKDYLAEDGKIPFDQWQMFSRLLPAEDEIAETYAKYFVTVEPSEDDED